MHMKTIGVLQIRRYQDSDYNTVWNLHISGLEQFDVDLGISSLEDDLRDIQNHYIKNGGEFLVGLHRGKIVCMGAFRRKSASLAEIKRMRVHQDYQKSGLGQIMLTTLEAEASRLGYTELCLDTTAQMLPARKLYEKNGYTETRRGQIAGLEIVYYYKKLARNKG